MTQPTVVAVPANSCFSSINTNSKMTSVDIAELTGKRHHHVLRSIKSLIDNGAITETTFGCSEYRDASGRMVPMYQLDFQATMTLITGYNAVLRSKVIARWIELETAAAAKIAKKAIPAPAPKLTPAKTLKSIISGPIYYAAEDIKKANDGIKGLVGALRMLNRSCDICCEEAEQRTLLLNCLDVMAEKIGEYQNTLVTTVDIWPY